MSAGRELNTFDEFAGYRSGDRVGFFGRWRKSLTDTQGEAKVVLHTKRKPIILFQHQGLPRVKVYENKDGVEVEELWSDDSNCHEEESIIAKQYAFDTQGRREVVPTRCSRCRLVAIVGEFVVRSERERVMATKARRAFDPTIGIPFYTPLFRFSARDAMEDKVIYAGPLVLGRKGMPKFNDLAADVRDLVKASRMNFKEVWGQDDHARKQVLFTLVGVAGNADADLDEAEGVQVAMERGMLFDRMQSEIVAQFKRKQTGKNAHPKAKERRDGDPWFQPYPFHWEYDKDAEIKDMYKVTALEEAISPKVRDLIESDPPDVSSRCKHFDQAKLRLFLEANAQVDLPFDEIFGRRDPSGKGWIPLESERDDGGEESADDTSFDHGANAPEVGRGLDAETKADIEKSMERSMVGTPAQQRVDRAEDVKKAPQKKEKPTKASTGRPFPSKEDDVDNDDNVLLCDDGAKGCKVQKNGEPARMWSTDHTCPHCGLVWDQAKADKEAAEWAARVKAEAAAKASEAPKGRKRSRSPSADASPASPPVGEKKDDVGF